MIGRPDMASDNDKVICIWEKTRQAVVKKGGIPFLILPNQDIEYEMVRPRDVPRLTTIEKEELKDLVDMCDGLLIPGGYKWYEFDEVIYKYALEKNMPILGICAGMQMMCKIDMDKNKVTSDVIVKNNTKTTHHQRDVEYAHQIKIQNNTKLKNIIGKNIIGVNSKHNYHVQKTNELTVAAYSLDGLIEAVEYCDKDFVLGVQWHPETMLDYDVDANKIFDKFIELSVGYKYKKHK